MFWLLVLHDYINKPFILPFNDTGSYSLKAISFCVPKQKFLNCFHDSRFFTAHAHDGSFPRCRDCVCVLNEMAAIDHRQNNVTASQKKLDYCLKQEFWSYWLGSLFSLQIQDYDWIKIHHLNSVSFTKNRQNVDLSWEYFNE